MKRLLRAVILAGLFLASATAQSDEKKAVDSLKVYVQHHLDSYQMNRRERVTKLGGGWVKQYFEMDVNSAEMDVQRTTSLISPYTARLDFRMILHLTAFHRSRDEAVEDTVFMQSDIYLHRHNYAYQDGKWVPKIRQHKWDIRNALVPMPWSDCTEVVMTGPDAGKTDMFGCLEEFDDVKREAQAAGRSGDAPGRFQSGNLEALDNRVVSATVCHKLQPVAITQA